ncbi:parkin coregulated gene protein homolog [Adelges cooleyi]|uniref:parkin coregulated gene protein homolog n=1 Tax=Adelges cooleyi TaxID=133065 RepID=UPI00217FBBDA|nr:parkin coregulated gene protein homolog [Adelges cooleyi]
MAAIAPTKRTMPAPRKVPGFCVQAYQKNTVTAGPPKTKKKPVGSTAVRTEFSILYGSPGFPLAVGSAGRVRWLIPVASVDYNVYLPLLFLGLREPAHPYGTCAALALRDMLDEPDCGCRVLEALPKIVFPIRQALDTGHWPIVVRTLKSLQKCATSDQMVGKALVPYYRQLLPPINKYLSIDEEVSDGLEANSRVNVMDLCAETLAVLERTGGSCAYINMKYVIPTYERAGGVPRNSCP